MAAAEQVKLRKRLEALLKLPENQICCDCKKRGPRWASVTLGVFMCIDCSGIHRNLGVHISFVRSVNLDSWTTAQVDAMEEWGNGRANLYYEANMPSHVSRPQDGDSVRMIEKFIRDKYELKKYTAKELPPKVQASEAMEEKVDGQMKKMKSVVTRQRPSAPITMSVPVPAAPAPSLINFMDFEDEPAPAVFAPLVPSVPNFAPPALPTFAPSFPISQNQNQTQFHQSVQATQASQWAPPSSGGVGFIDFGDFVSPVPASAPAFPTPQQQLLSQQKQEQILSPQQFQQQQSGFHSSPNEKPPPVPSMPPKPQASADAILSLYAVAPPPPVVNSMTGMNMNNMAGSNGISAMEGMNGGYNMINRMPQMGNFTSYGQQGQQLQNPQSHMLQQPQLQQQMMMQQQQHQQFHQNVFDGQEQQRQLGGMSQMGGNMMIGLQGQQMQPQMQQQQQYFQQQLQSQHQYQQQPQQPQYQNQLQQQYQQPPLQQRQQSQQQSYQSYTN